MSLRGAAYIMGAYEHPERKIADRSSAQVHYEVAAGALVTMGGSSAGRGGGGLAVGQRVRVTFEQAGEFKIPRFRPVL